MAKKRKGDPINGWIILDKPVGLTSTQAMAKVRRFCNAQKAGHAGTLDPLASGILPIALGEATKTIQYVQDGLKIYKFTVTWGEKRDTDDAAGKTVATSENRPTEAAIKALLPKYTGHIIQTPPQFSALKVDGQRAYDLAREGETVELKSREVYIESLKLLECRQNEADFEALCGKGTYIRSLARDMGEDLGTYGYISALRRERVGPFTLEHAISLDNMEKIDDIARLNEAVLPLETALDDIPALALREEETAKLKNGQTLAFIARPDVERLKAAGIGIEKTSKEALAIYKGKPVALIEIAGVNIKPVRVLNI